MVIALDVELTDDEKAAIDVAVSKQAEREPGLTAEIMLARMAKKLALGWANDMANQQTTRDLASIGEGLLALPASERLVVAENIKRLVRSTAPADDAERRNG